MVMEKRKMSKSINQNESSCTGQRIKLRVLLSFFLLVIWMNQQIWIAASATFSCGQQAAVGGDGIISPHLSTSATHGEILLTPRKTRTLGQAIVANAYSKSYKVLEDVCFPSVAGLKECIMKLDRRTLSDIFSDQAAVKQSNSNGIDAPREIIKEEDVPWWFETLIRDIASGENHLFSSWNYQWIRSRPISLVHCNIPKVASTQWKKLACSLTGKKFGDGCKNVIPPDYLINREEHDIAQHRSVFLRDPLERFLSGFVNKCIETHYRDREKHCEPNIIFRSDFNEVKNLSDDRVDLVSKLAKRSKTFFEAYVDSFPLKWNLHFLPQGLFCDLGREVPRYNFVGSFSSDTDLYRFGQQYNITEAVNEIFHLNAKLATNSLQSKRKAPKMTQQYFSARTVRRLLEIYSIDYLRLGLPIPDWAEELLVEEEKELSSI
eukprot:CAMPEP_0172578448 /NCGR_PEP_ID=MMETSP1067-20121228/138740_1 /TAXON_ID=265564 ORGANISM="Thalassiosira punctigera, Strain Tpunct2005C2" /NCGR_SAMPLE_ID=MMETSP1067 /ASSEMBLY_ACC=CAM_ASM_000444 /LENGTH=433 /DNA_ID=CAMNT_0013371145 /DNA_START=549 /DNA_END=1850 /DNA_ORIENTATION=+